MSVFLCATVVSYMKLYLWSVLELYQYSLWHYIKLVGYRFDQQITTSLPELVMTTISHCIVSLGHNELNDYIWTVSTSNVGVVDFGDIRRRTRSRSEVYGQVTISHSICGMQLPVPALYTCFWHISLHINVGYREALVELIMWSPRGRLFSISVVKVSVSCKTLEWLKVFFCSYK